MSWIGVITNAGASAMAAWTNGSVLNINRAVAGTGLAQPVSLLTQTSLMEEKQNADIVSSKIEGDARKIKIQIQAPNEGYTLNQIGLFAKMDNGEQVLLALFQNESGIAMPSKLESPDFIYIFYCYLKTSNQGTLSLTIDPSAIVAYGTMQEYVTDEFNKHNSDENAHIDIRETIKKYACKVIVTLSVLSWEDCHQRVAVEGLTAEDIVFVSPAPTSISVYSEAGIYAAEQGAGSLTFACETVPDSDLTVNVVILGGGSSQ